MRHGRVGAECANSHSWIQEQGNEAKEGGLSTGSVSWPLDTKGGREIRIHLDSGANVKGKMVYHIRQSLPAILRGEIAPIELIIANRLLDQYKQQDHPQALSQAAALLRQFVRRNLRTHILERGASALTATLTIVQAVDTAGSGGPLAASDHITKNLWNAESQASSVQGLAAWSDIVAFDTLDIKIHPTGVFHPRITILSSSSGIC